VEIAEDAKAAAHERAGFALHEDSKRIPVPAKDGRDDPAGLEVVLGRLVEAGVARCFDR
jgi:hypothetical protein